MKNFFQRYVVLGLSLVVLFASGVGIGRMSVTRPQLPVPQPLVQADSAESWVAVASDGLVRDLRLDAAQERKARQQLVTVANAIYGDRERTLFQMHLRLLQLHDTLANDGFLDDHQLERLKVSRAKLKDLIIRKFPRLSRANPTLANGS